MKTPAIAAVLALATASALGQAPQKPPPRCVDPVYRQFDFWIGRWEVTNLKGVKVGDSEITREEDGCLIVEHWTSASGNHGQSYNFYDAGRKVWRQVWVAPGEMTDYAGSLNAKGEMALDGVSQQSGGHTQKSRGLWTANADGTVTQNFKVWDPGKKAWVEDFTGIYSRKG